MVSSTQCPMCKQNTIVVSTFGSICGNEPCLYEATTDEARNLLNGIPISPKRYRKKNLESSEETY